MKKPTNKKDDVKIKTSEEWNFPKSIPLRYLLSAYHCLPRWHMENNMVIEKKKKPISGI